MKTIDATNEKGYLHNTQEMYHYTLEARSTCLKTIINSNQLPPFPSTWPSNSPVQVDNRYIMLPTFNYASIESNYRMRLIIRQ